MLCDTQTIGLSPTPAARSFWRSSLLLNAIDFLNEMKTAGLTGSYWLPLSLLSSFRQELLLTGSVLRATSGVRNTLFSLLAFCNCSLPILTSSLAQLRVSKPRTSRSWMKQALFEHLIRVWQFPQVKGRSHTSCPRTQDMDPFSLHGSFLIT